MIHIANPSKPGGGGKRVARFTVGTSTAGWTAADCDYLCDGADDQVEINAAIQALPAWGGEVVILDGTYNITAKIAVNKACVTLTGSGRSSVLKRQWRSPSNEGIISVTSSNITIRNLMLDGNTASFSSNNNIGIYLDSCSQNTIFGNMVQNNNFGIYLNACSATILQSNLCDNNDNRSIYLSSCNEIVVANNLCKNSGNANIDVVGGSGNVLTGNVSESSGHEGIKVSTCNGAVITGNTCNNNRSGLSLVTCSDAVLGGNICKNNTFGGISLNNCSNITVAGNTCNNNGTNGIDVYSSNNVTVVGNTCNNNGSCGVSLNSVIRNTIVGNTCIRGSGVAADYSSSQATIKLSFTSNNYNLIAYNLIMGKNYTSEGGTGNTFAGNKYN